MGKGHWRRPANVTDEELKEAWKRIFTEPKFEPELDRPRKRCPELDAWEKVKRHS